MIKTYNKDSVFSHSQHDICYDVTQQTDLDRFWRIKMLSPPSQYQVWHIYFWPQLTKISLHSNRFQRSFNWTSSWTDFFYDDVKCILFQYGLHHYVTGNIHGAIGETYHCTEIMVSDTKKLFSLWDCGQLIVILSRTRIIKNTIFVGPKNETILGLKLILTQITQWCDHIE